MLQRIAWPLFVVGLLLTACGPEPTPAAPVGLRFYDLDNVDMRDVPMLIALDTLATQGIQVKTTLVSGTALVGEAMVRGDADVAWATNQTIWSAIAEGASARTIAQSAGATAVLITTTDIQTCADLDGRPLATPSLSALNSRLLMVYVEQNCPGTEPQYVVLSDGPSRRAALLAGEMDGALAQTEELLRVEAEMPGQFHGLVFIGEAFPGIQVDGLHVRQEWAQQHPGAARAFLRAVLITHRQIIADPDMLYGEAEKRLDMDAETARNLGDAYLKIGVWDPNGSLTRDNVQTTLDFLTANTDLAPGLTVDDVADLTYLEDVLAEIGRQ